MSNLILNDNVIGGSSNDSNDILYTPNGRPETNVQDELDRINTNLGGLLAWTDNFRAQNGVVTVNYPTGFNQNNCAVASVSIYVGQDRVDTRYGYLVDLMANNISFNAFNWDIQFTVKILLIKTN